MKMYKGKDSILLRNADVYQTAWRQYPDYLNLEIKMIFAYLETRFCDRTLVVTECENFQNLCEYGTWIQR